MFLVLYNTRKYGVYDINGLNIEFSKRFKTMNLSVLCGEKDDSHIYFEIKDFYKHDGNRFDN